MNKVITYVCPICGYQSNKDYEVCPACLNKHFGEPYQSDIYQVTALAYNRKSFVVDIKK